MSHKRVATIYLKRLYKAGGRMEAAGFVVQASMPGRSRVPKRSPKISKRLELLGWILFVVSALFFIVASLRTGDVVGLLGGVFFLLACVVFLAAFGSRDGRD